MYSLLGLLLILGVIMLLIEAFTPNFGICGTLGIIFLSIFIGVVVGIRYGLLVAALAFVGLVIIAKLFYNYIKRHQLYGKIILDETLACERSELGNLEGLLGKEGMTKTPLKPLGVADFNGNAFEVCSDGEYILANKKIKVINVTKNKIIVRKCIEQA